MISDQALRSFLKENPQAAAIDAARATGCTEAEALTAQSVKVVRLRNTTAKLVLDEVRQWDQVLVLIRNADAVAELTVSGYKLILSEGDWLNYLEEGANLHIRISATTEVLGLIRMGKAGLTYSFNLVNETGEVFCRFYALTAKDITAFKAFCQRIDAESTKM
jgi:putative heme degradation protein